MRSNFKSWAARATALGIPPKCALCRGPTTPEAHLCDNCKHALARERDVKRRYEFCKSKSGESVVDIFAAYDYGGAAAELIRALKYGGAFGLAEEMAGLLHRALPAGFVEAGSVLVPVPAHPTTKRARGFNQAEALTRSLARRLGVVVADFLERSGDRAPQAQLSRQDRHAMPTSEIRVKSWTARHLRPNPLADFPTNVVVCDDVTTTGVTLEVCAYAIRERYGLESQPVQIKGLAFASTSMNVHRRAFTPTNGG